jgi:hypothetical protein
MEAFFNKTVNEKDRRFGCRDSTRDGSVKFLVRHIGLAISSGDQFCSVVDSDPGGRVFESDFDGPRGLRADKQV